MAPVKLFVKGQYGVSKKTGEGYYIFANSTTSPPRWEQKEEEVSSHPLAPPPALAPECQLIRKPNGNRRNLWGQGSVSVTLFQIWINVVWYAHLTICILICILYVYNMVDEFWKVSEFVIFSGDIRYGRTRSHGYAS